MRQRLSNKRRLLIALATFPLLELGTCLELTTESVITGAFDAVTGQLVDLVEDATGLSSSSTSTAKSVVPIRRS